MFETVAEECGERKRENNQVNPQPDLLFKAEHFNPGAFRSGSFQQTFLWRCGRYK